jgi:hypothetical protein
MNEKVGYLSVAVMAIGFISYEWVGATVASSLVLGGAAIGSLTVLYPFILVFKNALKQTSKKDEKFDAMISLMCRINGLKPNGNLKIYKQTSTTHPRFKHRTYVGDATDSLGKLRGIVIDIDEHLESPAGFHCDNPLASVRDEAWIAFQKFEREWQIGGVFADHFKDKITGHKTKLEWFEKKSSPG